MHDEVKDQVKKDYRSLVRSVPSMVMSQGLGQTLAFLIAKGKGKRDNEHGILYQHLSAWIGKPSPSQHDLLKYLTEQSSDEYRRVTVEVIAYLGWLKRFAEAELEDKP